MPLILLSRRLFGNGHCDHEKVRSSGPSCPTRVRTVDKRHEVRFLVFPTVHVDHHPNQFVNRNRFAGGRLTMTQLRSLVTCNTAFLSRNSYLLRKPARASPKLSALASFLQASIKDQNGWNTLDSGLGCELSINAASVAPCANLGTGLEA